MKYRKYTQATEDTLNLRTRIGSNASHPSERIARSDMPTEEVISSKKEMSPKCRFTRSSPESLGALSSLLDAATIALFTPVLLPAGQEKQKPGTEFVDPFEPFGRALSSYHKRVRHVPFVPKVGFSETHDAFLIQADAVVTVVCEPQNAKDPSLSHQMDFAEKVLDLVGAKEANASDTLVLVQCGAEQYRWPADAAFTNIIEVSNYDAVVAKQLAQTIFKFKL